MCLSSMLFSPDFSDVIFVCPDGTEIPAHRNILAAKNPYFRTYFGGPWTEQHPDGRWETEKSSDVIKALLSLMYTGEDSLGVLLIQHFLTYWKLSMNFSLMMILSESAKQSVLRISMSRMSRTFFLSAKHACASFLFDACFKYVCETFLQIWIGP